MKIMVTGHLGMLGREVHRAVERMGHEAIIPISDSGHSKDFDITKVVNLKGDPDVVINCAGLVSQHIPSPSPAMFMKVNGYGPCNLADRCDQIGARLIHVSTDCVFDGSGEGPHSEDDTPRPITPYGKSKLAGEITNDSHLTVRTSFVGFGEHGLIAELKTFAENGTLYQASNKLLWTGHTTRFVAEALITLAERDIAGLLHVPGETLTRYELLVLLRETLDLEDISFSFCSTPEIDRRLVSNRWARIGLPDLPSFEWQLEWLRRSQ